MKVIGRETQKGFAPPLIIIAVAGLIISAILIGKLINSGSKQVPASPISVPAIPTPTVSLGISKAPTAIPTTVKQTITQTPTATVPPYQLEARFVCARADEGYSFGDHLDLIYKVTVNGEPILGTLTLTDNKTKDVFDFAKDGPPGNAKISNWNGTLDWGLQDRNYKQMIFTGDGREYTLKLYKLTTVSEAVTKDLQPVAEITFSKICEF